MKRKMLAILSIIMVLGCLLTLPAVADELPPDYELNYFRIEYDVPNIPYSKTDENQYAFLIYSGRMVDDFTCQGDGFRITDAHLDGNRYVVSAVYDGITEKPYILVNFKVDGTDEVRACSIFGFVTEDAIFTSTSTYNGAYTAYCRYLLANGIIEHEQYENMTTQNIWRDDPVYETYPIYHEDGTLIQKTTSDSNEYPMTRTAFIVCCVLSGVAVLLGLGTFALAMLMIIVYLLMLLFALLRWRRKVKAAKQVPPAAEEADEAEEVSQEQADDGDAPQEQADDGEAPQEQADEDAPQEQTDEGEIPQEQADDGEAPSEEDSLNTDAPDLDTAPEATE